jgi:hypothetical protein
VPWPAADAGVEGDSLGGDFSAFGAVRLYLPPLIPSIRLANAGVRTQLFVCAGTVTSSPPTSKRHY